MTNKERINSPQKIARVAAFVFLIIFFLGMSTELFIRPGMIVPGDAAATVKNIAASEALFRLSLVSDLIRQALLMLLPLILYKLLKPVNKNIASLMVIFALVCVTHLAYPLGTPPMPVLYSTSGAAKAGTASAILYIGIKGSRQGTPYPRGRVVHLRGSDIR